MVELRNAPAKQAAKAHVKALRRILKRLLIKAQRDTAAKALVKVLKRVPRKVAPAKVLKKLIPN